VQAPAQPDTPAAIATHGQQPRRRDRDSAGSGPITYLVTRDQPLPVAGRTWAREHASTRAREQIVATSGARWTSCWRRCDFRPWTSDQGRWSASPERGL